MLKLVGTAVAGTAGFLARSDNAEAALVTNRITDVLNDLSIDVDVKNNNAAEQVCAVVEVISSDLLRRPLTRDIQQ